MLYLLLLFAFVEYCSGRAVVLNLDPNVENYRLEPINDQKTVWNIMTMEGSQTLFSCLAKRCSMNTARIIHGDIDWNACFEWEMDAMTITTEISTLVLDPSNDANVYCNVSTTKSYLNVEDISTESDEEGLPIDEKPTCPCGWTNKEGGRVVGGKRALKNEYPFMATVGRVGESRPDCGGSIITPYHVLTAAHCIFQPFGFYKYQVGVGVDALNETGENDHTQIINVSTVFVHENYRETGQGSPYDISLLYLERKIIFNQWIGPVCMPRGPRVELGEYLKVIGWGKLHSSHRLGSNYLMKANLRVLDVDICDKLYSGRVLGRSQYCTFHLKKDSCFGDSGGPLVMVNPRTNMLTQHAMVSFGDTSCNTSHPALNTDVAWYLPWIKGKIDATQPETLCY